MATFLLSVRDRATSPIVLPANGEPLTVGRDPTSHISIAEPKVSWNHARIWVEDGKPMVHDNGSRNGTMVDGVAAVGPTIVANDGTIDLGGVVVLQLRRIIGDTAEATSTRYFVDDLDTGMRYAVRGISFTISDRPGADMPGLGHPPARLSEKSGQWWILMGPLAMPVPSGEPFLVYDRRMVIRKVGGATINTVSSVTDALHPLEVEAWLGRSYAEVRSLGGTVLLEVRGETRTALLWVLAQAQGWCDEADVAQRVWGRASQVDQKNRMKVSVHRLRKDFEAAGLQIDLLQRRNGALRLAAQRLVAHEA